MAVPAEQNLPLILAREFASNIATPLALIDASGRLLYFKGPAERRIGAAPAELGELTEDEWRARFSAERLDGTPAPIDQMASVIARRKRRPAHGRLVITTLDGLRRTL